MTPGTARRLLATAALVSLVLAAGCGETREAIVVHPDRIVVSNLTGETWRDIELSVNRYYRARFDALAPGGRIDAPLRRFQGGFGRYFDVRRERVTAVRVTATGTAGSAVVLDWPASRDR